MKRYDIIGHDAEILEDEDGEFVAYDDVEQLQQQNQEMLEMLKEVLGAEWMVTHDWGGDRQELFKRAYALITKIEHDSEQEVSDEH